MVDIGAAGRQSDGGVFSHSKPGNCLKNNELKIPQAEPFVPEGKKFPYVFLGDEAFALTNYLLRPYPSSGLDFTKKVFNYRLSRARRIVEAAFGTLSNVWQVFKNSMKTSLPVTMEVVKASVCLHNFLLMYEPRRHRKDKDDDINYRGNQLQAVPQENLNVVVDEKNANLIRDYFAEFFMNEGAVGFQWEKARNCDF